MPPKLDKSINVAIYLDLARKIRGSLLEDWETDMDEDPQCYEYTFEELMLFMDHYFPHPGKKTLSEEAIAPRTPE